jgi:S-adenosylmethionine:tRNA ribosyltransferase-isomerase
MLGPKDVLVLNDTKVFPARLIGKKSTGGRCEIFLLRDCTGGVWEAMTRGKNLKAGMMIDCAAFHCRLQKRDPNHIWRIQCSLKGKKLRDAIWAIGQTPLPPYIKRPSSLDRYQTVYATREGSVAAPTAGLHFTPRLLQQLRRRGVSIQTMTLHVGLGTFQPIHSTNIENHRIHEEWCEITRTTANALNAAKQAGKRIIAVGTTTVRTLEACTKNGRLQAFRGSTHLTILPGHRFQFVDAMITNFHLPKSSLLVLVSAFAGRRLILRAYRAAIRHHYRFYSFGDAMWIV